MLLSLILKAENVTAGTGNGSTGGFRFRAMSDRDMDGGNIPVFDVYKDDKQLFKVDPLQARFISENTSGTTLLMGLYILLRIIHLYEQMEH